MNNLCLSRFLISLLILLFLFCYSALAADHKKSTLRHNKYPHSLQQLFVSKQIKISQGNVGSFEPAIDSDGEYYYISWYDTRHEKTSIYASKINGSDPQLGKEKLIALLGENCYEPSIIAYKDFIYISYYSIQDTFGKKSSSQVKLVKLDKDLDVISTFNFLEHDTNCSTRSPTLFGNSDYIYIGFIRDGCSRDDESKVMIAKLPVTIRGETKFSDIIFNQFNANTDGTWNINGDSTNERVALVFDTKGEKSNRNISIIFCEKEILQCKNEVVGVNNLLDNVYPDIELTDKGYTIVSVVKNASKSKVVSFYKLFGSEDLENSNVTDFIDGASGAYLASTERHLTYVWHDNGTNGPAIKFSVNNTDNQAAMYSGLITEPGTRVFVPNIVAKNTDCYGITWNDLRRSNIKSFNLSDVYFAEICVQ